MKRRRIQGGEGGLTGGTGDVNPQYMNITVTQSAADTTTTQTQAIPIQRLPSGGRAQVMEILKILATTPSFSAIAAVGETEQTMNIFLSTTSFGTTATTFSEPRVIWNINKVRRGAFTAGGTYAYEYSLLDTIDLTDGAGHGFLVATDNLFLQYNSGGTGATNTCRMKILYRWKDVSLSEYIGIVQSQQ